MSLSRKDVLLLNRLYYRDITISEDLLAHLHQKAASTRLFAVNLELISNPAQNLGLTTIDLAA